jgi:flagellar biosynthesis chaperone FliJ
MEDELQIIESDDEEVYESENDGESVGSNISSLSSNSNIIIMYDLDDEPRTQMVIPIPISKKKIIQIERIDIEEEEEIQLADTCINCKVNHELLILVQNLTLKINSIENQLKLLIESNNRKSHNNNNIPALNKKMDVLQWLNTYVIPSTSFDDFIEDLIVNMYHFEFLMDYKLTETIQKIIQTNFVRKDDFIYPMFSTVEKSGKVYVYDENDTWELISIEHLSKFVKKIENKLSKICIDWKNRHDKSDSSKLNNKLQSAILKLYNISYTQDTTMNRIRSDLHVQLKSVCKIN